MVGKDEGRSQGVELPSSNYTEMHFTSLPPGDLLLGFKFPGIIELADIEGFQPYIPFNFDAQEG